MNAGHTLPTIVQAFIYISIVVVDPRTLLLMIAAAVIGAWMGAGIVASWPRRAVQLAMGSALLAASGLMLMTQLELFPAGGNTLGVSGVRLAIGLVGNFVLGVLMTVGVGLYAPCTRAAFPIMMGSCAFLMPLGSLRFIRVERYDRRAALGLALGGVPAVLLAAFVVRSLPLWAVRWLVILVVVYTAISMLRAGLSDRPLGVEDSSRVPA